MQFKIVLKVNFVDNENPIIVNVANNMETKFDKYGEIMRRSILRVYNNLSSAQKIRVLPPIMKIHIRIMNNLIASYIVHRSNVKKEN